jgi:lipid-binding SYLF domain-containing protein
MEDIMRTLYGLLLVLIATFFFPSASYSNDAKDVSDNATKIVNDIFGTTEESIPKWLLDKAQAVLVIPDYNKNGKENQGIFAVRADDNGTWSLPSIAKVTTGTATNDDAESLVLLFMTGQAYDDLHKGNTIVAGKSLEAGPAGTTDEKSFEGPDNDIVYVYSVKDNKAKGTSVDQVVVTSDNTGNKDLYGKDVTMEQITNQDISDPSEKAVQFQATLNAQSIKK